MMRLPSASYNIPYFVDYARGKIIQMHLKAAIRLHPQMTLASNSTKGKVASAESKLKPMDEPKDTPAPAALDSIPISNSAKATAGPASKAFPDDWQCLHTGNL